MYFHNLLSGRCCQLQQIHYQSGHGLAGGKGNPVDRDTSLPTGACVCVCVCASGSSLAQVAKMANGVGLPLDAGFPYSIFV